VEFQEPDLRFAENDGLFASVALKPEQSLVPGRVVAANSEARQSGVSRGSNLSPRR
jgi:uncharacterized membrane-anchored protein